jgi:NADPH2:quinone reductase
MRAVVCRAFGPPETLVIEERPRPVPGAGEVLLQVQAIGVNFTDVLAIEGRSQLKRQLPMIPGVEAAGVVLAVGPGVTRLRPGQRVLGCRTHGTYAEEVLFDEDELAPIPEEMDMHGAAAFYIAAMTVHYALQARARLAPGEILLVLGAGGGAGLAGVEIGKALGARVVAAASSQEKLALALRHGADDVVLYERGPLDLEAQKRLAAELIAKAQRTGEGAQTIGKISSVHVSAGYHVILDGVGGTYTEPALRTLAGRDATFQSARPACRASRSDRRCSGTPTSWASSRHRMSTAFPDAMRAPCRPCSTGTVKGSSDPWLRKCCLSRRRHRRCPC